jgi:putative membrane protein insertion efficiency factor
MVQAYRYTLSPLVGFECRHLPTCSNYADQALDHYGLWAGGWMTLPAIGHFGPRCRAAGVAGKIALVYAVALRTLARHQSRPGQRAVKFTLKSFTLTQHRFAASEQQE